LEGRGTDSAESIADRVSRAQYEIEQAPLYDAQVVNDDLAAAVEQTRALITRFLND
jgi:guanylate kinase